MTSDHAGQSLAQGLFHLLGDGVPLGHGELRVHLDVEVDEDLGGRAARADRVAAEHARHLVGDGADVADGEDRAVGEDDVAPREDLRSAVQTMATTTRSAMTGSASGMPSRTKTSPASTPTLTRMSLAVWRGVGDEHVAAQGFAPPRSYQEARRC